MNFRTLLLSSNFLYTLILLFELARGLSKSSSLSKSVVFLVKFSSFRSEIIETTIYYNHTILEGYSFDGDLILFFDVLLFLLLNFCLRYVSKKGSASMTCSSLSLFSSLAFLLFPIHDVTNL